MLAVSSPTLAAYYATLTVLNGRWLARRFSHISYTNAYQALRILNSLQQSPLQITNEGSLLSSLIILPENDKRWNDLMDRLDYTHIWSISASTAIAWVFYRVYINSYRILYQRDGWTFRRRCIRWAGGWKCWLWLLPIAITMAAAFA